LFPLRGMQLRKLSIIYIVTVTDWAASQLYPTNDQAPNNSEGFCSNTRYVVTKTALSLPLSFSWLFDWNVTGSL